MANICSVNFYLEFTNNKRCADFAKSFKSKIKDAEKKSEGVRVSQDTWLFDIVLDFSGKNKNLTLNGWVKWGLTHAAIREFVESIKKDGLLSLECEYEETGNLIFGKYEYHDGDLWDSYIEDSHSVWDESYEDDNYYDLLDDALENDGTSVMVA